MGCGLVNAEVGDSVTTHSVILGIGQTHNASACLLVDGVLAACASEERFSRLKNTASFPLGAARYVLRECGVEPGDVDAVVHSFRHPVTGLAFEGERTARAATHGLALSQRVASRVVGYCPPADGFLRGVYRGVSRRIQPSYEERFRTRISRVLGVERSRVRLEDHHRCHAFAGYAFYVDGQTWDIPALIFTLDAEGDDKSATVSIAHRGRIRVLATTPGGRSIGVLYGAVTEWLGMLVNEHEYKVMGLAPYAPTVLSLRAQAILEPLVWVDGLVFRTRPSSGAFRHLLRKQLEGQRFDAVAAGIQSLLERRVVEWVRNAIRHTGISNVVLSGGVFMNVKANMAVMEMPEVSSLTVCPSAADESSPIGAAYGEYCRRVGTSLTPSPQSRPQRAIDNLYLGPAFRDAEVREALFRNGAESKYQLVRIPEDGESDVLADLLAQGNVVARFAGRMEFGARALGNRSILADPSQRHMVRLINEQIKGRDFWMPFACTILADRASAYLDNPKILQAPYMSLAFRTRAACRDELAAGIHPYDYTIRPQLLERHHNPRYYDVVRAFERRTGIGALLNTSFNMHGEPIVCTPTDALDVFDRSGLTVLQLEGWLVQKGKH